MGDQLERFIINHREEFDTDEPLGDVWGHIQRKNQTSQKWTGLWKAAAVVFLISTIFLIVEKKMSESVLTESAMSGEFVQVEDYYTELIGQKKQEIAAYGENELGREFLIEIERLDKMYASLKQTYMSQNSSEVITDMMIQNLQLRIEILNKQVKILNELKRQENESTNDMEI